MSTSRIAARYAKSLIDLSQEQNSLDATLEDIKTFKNAIENRDFYLLLKSPIVNTGKKKDIIKALFEGKLNRLTMMFMDIVLRKGRENYLPEIADEFVAQYKSINKITTIKLTTASPISDSNLQQIKSRILASDASEDSLDIETFVDSNLVGGFVIEIGDKLYDASIAHRLEELRKEFSDNSMADA